MTNFEKPDPGIPGEASRNVPSHEVPADEVSTHLVETHQTPGHAPRAAKAKPAAATAAAAAAATPRRQAPAAAPKVASAARQQPIAARASASTSGRQARYTGTARTTETTHRTEVPRRGFNWAIPLALAALATTGIFAGLFASKGDSSDYAKSSIKIDEKLPYATEMRRTINEADISAAEARDAATDKVSGTVVSESLETDHGYASWDVDVLGDDGEVHSMMVDPNTGKVLRDKVNTQANMTDLNNAASSPTSAAAVADMVADNGRTPAAVIYDAGAKEWAATSWKGGNAVQQNYNASTGQMISTSAVVPAP